MLHFIQGNENTKCTTDSFQGNTLKVLITVWHGWYITMHKVDFNILGAG